jgi:hypothetical protein
MNTILIPAFSPYKVFLIGGSQNIGYHTALRLMGEPYLSHLMIRMLAHELQNKDTL